MSVSETIPSDTQASQVYTCFEYLSLRAENDCFDEKVRQPNVGERADVEHWTKRMETSRRGRHHSAQISSSAERSDEAAWGAWARGDPPF